MKKYKKLIFISIFIILFSVYLYYENNYLQITSYSIKNDKIPSSFNNFKIVQISDFHNTKSRRLTNDLVSSITKIKPDIIVLTGDLVDSFKEDINVSINLISKIKNIAPIYYVSGNHEASINDYEKLIEKLEENNVEVLRNTNRFITKNNDLINIIGINDPKFLSNDYYKDEDIINDELKSITYDNNIFTILLSHRPELINVYAKNKIDLVISGHAHGGQIRIPFTNGLVAPNQGLFPKYTSGVFKEDNTNLVISRGIGNSILPFRINNRPELVIITLNS